MELNVNIAEFHEKSSVSGPGLRFVLWVRGCGRACDGCIDPGWRQKDSTVIDIRTLLEKVLVLEDQLEGITISGGEPFLQSEPLALFANWVKQYTGLGLIVYTGYKYKDLLDGTAGVENKDAVREFLSHIDLLIDGEYVAALNDDRGIRGSSNQEFIFLTQRYRAYAKEMETGKRNVQIDVDKDLLIGVPPRKLIEND